MLHRIHQKLGTAGFIISIVALIAAVGGTALAAGGLTKSQEKQVTKIAKKYAGKPGAAGANGTNGTNGSPGEKGAPGAPGTPGTNGKSVVVGTTSSGCTGSNPAGGVTVEVEGEASTKKTACNGKEGSPWTAGGTLPSGKTETGDFASLGVAVPAFGGTFISGNYLIEPISFPLPLASPPASIHLIANGEGEGEANENPAVIAGECTGTVQAPGAASGNLCLFLSIEQNLDLNRQEISPGVFGPPRLTFGHTSALTPCELNAGACTTGTALLLHPETAHETEPILVTGTWAVTAE